LVDDFSLKLLIFFKKFSNPSIVGKKSFVASNRHFALGFLHYSKIIKLNSCYQLIALDTRLMNYYYHFFIEMIIK